MRLFTHSAGHLALLLLVLCCSCGKAYRKIPYFKDVPDSLRNVPTYSTGLSAYKDITVQPDDILQISVQTIDPQANALMGSSNELNYTTQAAATSTGTAPLPGGFLVDRSGFIDMPLTGRIHVAGLNTTQVKDSVRQRAQLFYKEPVVNVRFANFKITVLGEVAKPATYTVPNERINLLDALGMAGDLTIYGKRENILLIRTEQDRKVFVRFDLNSSDIYGSPYLQLQQGDVVYVEPTKAKAATRDASKARTYSLIAAATSLLLVFFSRVSF